LKKKAAILFTLFFAFAISQAQLPDFWAGDTDIETFQETTTVHGDTSSCGVIVNSGTQDNCNLSNTVAIEVTEGDSYKVSFWVNSSAHVRVRAFCDWVGVASTYPNYYVGPATNGWEKYEFTDIVPTGATGVKLRLKFYDTPGFLAPENQFIDDLEFQSPVGVTLVVSNGNFESWPTLKPEPSNYPTEFTSTPLGLNIELNWVDAVGAQLPDAYLILASTQNNITAPVDSTFVVDNLDLTYGTGAANVAFGTQTFTFTGLEGQTAYYFSIYPYTNAGTNINYKTDGAAPSVEILTGYVVSVLSENFDESWGEWQTVSIIGDQVWYIDTVNGMDQTACARISGHSSGNSYQNEDWLISPLMDLDDYNKLWFTFYLAMGFPSIAPQLSAKISTDYNNGSDPNSANWTNLLPNFPTGDLSWVFSGVLNISGFDGNNVHVAFVYVSDTSESSTWEVDKIMIAGEPIFFPEPTNYPTSFDAMVTNQNITLTWMDAIGTIIPSGYLVLASNQSNISLPTDGVSVANDTDFSDGKGALNVSPGDQGCVFSNLTPHQTFYFKIFSYTNMGININFKTDSIPPEAQAMITTEPEPSNYPTVFENQVSLQTITLTWVDAIGTTIPTGYLIKASNQSSISYPVDGTPIADDLDFDDGNGAKNVAAGLQTYTFIGLAANSTYYFNIYPYTNIGADIDYKTDGIIPSQAATTGSSTVANYRTTKVTVSPNPSDGKIDVVYEHEFDLLEIYSLTGRRIVSNTIVGKQFQADLSEFGKGIYLISLSNKKTGIFVTRKIVIN